MNNKIDEKSSLSYDDRRKELTQIKTQTAENKREQVMEGEKVIEKEKLISTVEQNMKVVYTEEGIRLAHKNLSNQKKAMEMRSAQLKKQFEGSEEMPNDLKEFKKKMELLSKFAVSDKAKVEYESIQIELKSVKQDIEGIKNAVGTRLKL